MAPAWLLPHGFPERAELGDRLPRVLDGGRRVAAPQVDAAEEHLENSRHPPVAGRLALGELLVREPLRLVEAALHEPHPREHRERPVQAAPVVEGAEHLGGRHEPLVGPIGVTAEEGRRRQVLHRPRLAAAMTHPPEQLECGGHVGLGAVEVAPEHQRAAARPEGVRLTGLVAERMPCRDRPVQRRDRVVVVARHLVEVSEHGERPGRRAGVAGRVVEHVVEISARGGELPQLREGPGPPELQAPARLGRSRRGHDRERLVEEAGGAVPHLGRTGPLGRHLEHLEGARREVAGDSLDRAELAEQHRGGPEMMRDTLDRRAAVVRGSAGGEPLAEGGVAAGALRFRERRVRNLAHHLVRELELARIDIEELAVGKLLERDVGVERVAAHRRERMDRLDRAARADDGAILEHVALGGAEPVEPRRHEPLEGDRETPRFQEAPRRVAVGGPGLAEQRGELLDEERVAAAALVQQRHDVGRRVRAE